MLNSNYNGLGSSMTPGDNPGGAPNSQDLLKKLQQIFATVGYGGSLSDALRSLVAASGGGTGSNNILGGGGGSGSGGTGTGTGTSTVGGTSA